MEVEEIGGVGVAEGVGVERGVEFFEGAVVGRAFEVFGGDGNEAPFDGGEDQVFGVDEEHTLLGADQDFAGLGGGLFGGGELGDELLEALGGAGVGFDFLFGFLDGFGEAGLVVGVLFIMNGIHS